MFQARTLVITIAAFLFACSSMAKAAFIDVFPNPSSLPNAVSSASPGDTLRLHDGIYDLQGSTLSINKSITLESVNIGGAIIDGGGASNVIYAQGFSSIREIQTSRCVISDFKLVRWRLIWDWWD